MQMLFLRWVVLIFIMNHSRIIALTQFMTFMLFKAKKCCSLDRILL